MQYMTCSEAAARWGITARRIQQMCKKGEIPGARKEGRSWQIPSDVIFNGKKVTAEVLQKQKKLPIGISDFKVATTKYYYVDKTLLIRDFLDTTPMVSLFTRPRRFGKTLNMDMLRVFFEKTSEDTSIYFKDKKIWQCGPEYTSHQGQYPVIYLTFKDVKCSTWAETYNMIKKLIAAEYLRHADLRISSILNSDEKELYNKNANQQGDSVDYQLSLQTLSRLLHKHHGKEAIIIIDEYDTPIQNGHTCGFYNQVTDFMRNFFSGGLKDNSHLAYGFLTGILRVAKESIFSGLNNLKSYSILDDAYSQYFGFTKDEVKQLLMYFGVAEKYDEVCEWYDGYRFGTCEIFNPWSVLNYLADKCFPQAFWQATGSNDFIGEIIAAATPEIIEDLHRLLSGQAVTTYIDTSVIYPEIHDNPYNIYSFLLIAGYLRVSALYPQHDGNFMCDVTIPNREIAYVYQKEILAKTNQSGLSVSIQQALFTGNAQKIQTLLEDFMLRSISSYDGVNEGFYHGMMLGLCALLSNRYQIRSNREAGYGRFDIQLLPLDKANPGFIFEFKYASNDTVDLEALAETALVQIEEKKYAVELSEAGISNIIKIGIAFRGKRAAVKKRL